MKNYIANIAYSKTHCYSLKNEGYYSGFCCDSIEEIFGFPREPFSRKFLK